jgi:hypothetical protein
LLSGQQAVPLFPLLDFLKHNFETNRIHLVLFFCWGAYFLFMFNMWFSQLLGVLKNATIYERLTNRNVNDNPFDLGWRNNIRQFLGIYPFRVDWTNVHSLSDVYHI